MRDFATALGLKPFKLTGELMEMGIFAGMNQSIEEAVAMKIAERHGCMLEIKHRGETVAPVVAKVKVEKPAEDESKFLQVRPPVVCILGHVDHGKTSLLDAIRKAHVAAGEAGGITQHIGAYQVEFKGRKITFLDTPGHAAFNKMRARGASVTDIAVLVVAADDGFMPQTDEALKHIQNAKVALIVAVNKMDMKGANLDRVKGQMQERGIPPEDWGGETITVPTAAVKDQGISELLDYILLQADVLELKANPKAEVAGVIIESQIDVGRGRSATVIVQRGTLRTGDAIVCGSHYARVRAMFDDRGEIVKEAPPSSPVKIIGWSGTPDSGATFKAVKNAREAERLAEEEQNRLNKETVTLDSKPKEISVEKLFAEIAASQQNTLRVVLKCDVFGSIEAVRNILDGIKSQKVALEIVSGEVGLIGKNDVLMAGAAGAVIIGFNTKLENGVTPLAKHHGVRIETFEIIYELGDKVREMMADLLRTRSARGQTRRSRSPPDLPGLEGLCRRLPGHRGQDRPQRAGPRAPRQGGPSSRARWARSGASKTTPTKCAPAWNAASGWTDSMVIRRATSSSVSRFRRSARRSDRPCPTAPCASTSPCSARSAPTCTRATRAKPARITITGVVVSPDLHDARAFYSVLGGKAEKEDGGRWLQEKTGEIRHIVGKTVVLKNVPRLEFVLDGSPERGTRVIQLLNEIEARDGPEAENP